MGRGHGEARSREEEGAEGDPEARRRARAASNAARKAAFRDRGSQHVISSPGVQYSYEWLRPWADNPRLLAAIDTVRRRRPPAGARREYYGMLFHGMRLLRDAGLYIAFLALAKMVTVNHVREGGRARSKSEILGRVRAVMTGGLEELVRAMVLEYPLGAPSAPPQRLGLSRSPRIRLPAREAVC